MVKKYRKTDDLGQHLFTITVFEDAVSIDRAISVPGSQFKVDADYQRKPTQAEFYCLSVGRSLASLLSICQQLEHSIFYFSSFTPSEKMRKAGISRQSHLLYCIENYIIRTRSMYDRVLRLVDKVFLVYNPSRLISHELVISNIHFKNSDILSRLKSIRNPVKDFIRERNEIIHERKYLEDDLRELEGYTIFLSIDEAPKNDKNFKFLINNLVSQIVKGKTKLFTEVNKKVFTEIAGLFDECIGKYQEQLQILEAIHGKVERYEDSRVR